jgi:hypothetical protein
MPRKIYDIKPPKVAKKIERSIKEFLQEDLPAQAGKKPKHHAHQKKEGHSIWMPVSICFLVVVLAVGVYLYIKLPKADIIIWPKVDTLSFQQTVTADKSASAVDATKNVIPAQYFQTTKTDTQGFPATGSASNDGEASGTITIYNKCDPSTPFNFRAGTHFMADSGKIFVALQKISIPAAIKSGSKVTPGSVQITVQAVESGDSYNVAPSNFSVPGLKGTPSYYCVSATSTSAMTGGHIGKVKQVTSDDIQGAKDVLTKKTTDDAMSSLKSQISADYVLLDNAVLSNVTDASTQTKSGSIAEDFNYRVTVQASALAFKKADLEKFAKDYIISQVPQGETLLDNSFKIDYSASTVDISGGKATLNLNFSSGAYQNVDKNSLTLSLIGENSNQIKETINSALGDRAPKVQISFWPFWVKAAPNSQNAVNIKLKF